MTKNFIHFLSEIPCMLAINGKNIGDIDNQNNFELDIITNNKKVYVTYSPLVNSNYTIPYTFAIDNNLRNINNEYIKVIPFPNNQYDIIMKPFYYYQIAQSEILLNQSVGNCFVNIINDNNSHITIYHGTTIVFSINTKKLLNAKCETISDYLIIQGIVDSDNYYLLILNTKDFSIIYNEITQSIEKTSDYLQSYRKLNTIPKHAEVCKLDFTNKNKQIYYVYENNSPRLPHSTRLIPYCVLESIKFGDNNIIKTYLSNTLANTPIDKFRSFFGNIQEIYLNRHIDNVNKLNYTIFNGQYKNYNFIMKDNKISDIEEIF